MRWLVFLMTAGVVLAMLLVPPFLYWGQQKELAASARSTAQETALLSPRQALKGLAAYYKLNGREHRPATLQLSLDEKDLQALKASRKDALAQGWITSKHKQQLPAVISVNDRRMNASCLLYTSPSPRDQRGSRMPSSA